METILEKEFDELLKKTDVDLLRDFSYTEPLIPRDAYYGGRTGACKL